VCQAGTGSFTDTLEARDGSGAVVLERSVTFAVG